MAELAQRQKEAASEDERFKIQGQRDKEQREHEENMARLKSDLKSKERTDTMSKK